MTPFLSGAAPFQSYDFFWPNKNKQAARKLRTITANTSVKNSFT